jgi:hypothetical protein
MRRSLTILSVVTIFFTTLSALADGGVNCIVNGVNYPLSQEKLQQTEGFKFAQGLAQNLELNLSVDSELDNTYQLEILLIEGKKTTAVVTVSGELGKKGFFYNGIPSGADRNVTEHGPQLAVPADLGPARPRPGRRRRLLGDDARRDP